MDTRGEMRISVVVPFRDAEPHLARCLASLRGQEPFDGDYQVIAVADRSSDGSTSVVRRFPEVRLMSASNTGPYAARNAGAAASDGDVIALTDADCEVGAAIGFGRSPRPSRSRARR